MSDTLQGSLQVRLATQYNNILAGGLGTTGVSIGPNFQLTFTDGVAIDQADKLWASQNRVLNSAATENIDVYNFGAIDIGTGPGEDPLGNALALVSAVGLIVISDPASVGVLIVGGEGSAAAWSAPFNNVNTGAVVVRPGGILTMWAPGSVGFVIGGASTNHLLKMLASGGAVTYSIYVIGRSA